MSDILQSTPETIEEVQCFKLKIWSLQCKYSKCVLKYVSSLKSGSNTTSELNKLTNFKNILKIANCYNTDDILYNVFLYNNISKQQVYNLITSLK